MKSCHIIVGMLRSTGLLWSTDLRKKGTRGEEEMSQSTLRHSMRERESEEKERELVVMGEISSLE